MLEGSVTILSMAAAVGAACAAWFSYMAAKTSNKLVRAQTILGLMERDAREEMSVATKALWVFARAAANKKGRGGDE